jgi:hypothetical protein
VQVVPVAAGYTIRSSALLSPPLNGDGDRAIFFVAIRNKPEVDGAQPSIGGNEAGIDHRKLFKVTVTRPRLLGLPPPSASPLSRASATCSWPATGASSSTA